MAGSSTRDEELGESEGTRGHLVCLLPGASSGMCGVGRARRPWGVRWSRPVLVAQVELVGRIRARVGERMINREAAVSRGSILLVAGTDVHAEALAAVVMGGTVTDTDAAERFILGRLTTRVSFGAAVRAIPVRDHAASATLFNSGASPIIRSRASSTYPG